MCSICEGPTMQYPTKSALPLAQLLPWQQSQFTQGKKQGSKMGDVELPKHIVKLQYLAQQQTKQYDLLPPTPKNTPFFMTPPVTPPNEALHSAVMHSLTQNSNVQVRCRNTNAYRLYYTEFRCSTQMKCCVQNCKFFCFFWIVILVIHDYCNNFCHTAAIITRTL